LDVVAPTHVNPNGAIDMLSTARRGTKEETMLRRSAFEPTVARSLMSVWAKQDPWIGFTPRPPNELCSEHALWNQQLRHNYSIFASRYAPQLSCEQLERVSNVDMVIVVPITTVDERLCVLVPLTSCSFGVSRAEGTSVAEHAKDICVFLGGEESMLACPIKEQTRTTYVFAVPVEIKPTVLVSPAEMLEARRDGAEAVWCHASDAAILPGYSYISAATMRLREMFGCTNQAEVVVGSRGKAAPAIRSNTSAMWNTKDAAALKDSSAERQKFLEKDEALCAEFRKALIAVDGGDGVCCSFALMVKSAKDIQSELPATPQLLPEFNHKCLRLALMPQRPPPLVTEWLHAVPQQKVPPGAEAMSWIDIVKRFARGLICDTINKNAAYDLECWKTGKGKGHRAPFLALDDRVAKSIMHADGIGSWNAFEIIWERRHDGMYEPMDFKKAYAEHKNIDFLRVIFKDITDLELLSILFDGMQYKAACEHGQTNRQGRYVSLTTCNLSTNESKEWLRLC